MLSILVAFAIALLVSATTTPLVRRIALALGAVDDPTARRVHTRKIPRLGGIAIVLAFFVPLLALYAFNTSVARQFFVHTRLVGGLFFGALVLAVLGALDDLVGVRARWKLLVQIIAALIAYAGGYRIDAVTLPIVGQLSMGWFSLPLTVLWITGVINAINLIDGLDGLAAGVAFFACLTNFVIAYLGGHMAICLLGAILAGAIVGFLFHNFNPATIFMGDTGSMFLGFVLAVLSLLGAGAQKGGTAVAILVPILALGVPIFDTLFAMARRVLERRSIFSPDRGHIHHRLLDLGITHRRAVLILYGTSLVLTGSAILIYLGRSWQFGLALLALTVTLFGVVRFVGHFQGSMMRREQRERKRGSDVERMRRAVPPVLARLDASAADGVHSILEHFAEEAGLLLVELSVGVEATPAFHWQAPRSSAKTVRESQAVRFTIRDSADGKLELLFRWDSVNGDVSPQAEILLQLLADSVEHALTRPARAREAVRTGRLRPVS